MLLLALRSGVHWVPDLLDERLEKAKVCFWKHLTGSDWKKHGWFCGYGGMSEGFSGVAKQRDDPAGG